MARCRLGWICLFLVATSAFVGPSAADEPQPPQSAGGAVIREATDAFTPSAEFQDWITALARQHIPTEYEMKKNWGHTAKSVGGLSVRLDHGQLKTHRKFKEANDGQWQMYRVKLKDPDEKFEIQIANIHALSAGRVALEITAIADLEVFGRQSLWEHGVQIFSLSAEADARVRLRAQAEIATKLDTTRFPPDVQLDPDVKAATLDIPDFRLRRVGELHGPVVRSLSHATREVLEDKLADDNAKLVASLNKQIAKQEKKLKLSLADIMQSKWSGLLGPIAGAKSCSGN